MLTLTDNATQVIWDLTHQDQVPEGAGLRIAADPAAGALMLSLSPAPEEGDKVLDERGARLFLDAGTAPLLDDKSLDAAVDDQGGVEFTLAEQPPAR
jgi:Fe-S cluster assembly iron-binding protein IscA